VGDGGGWGGHGCSFVPVQGVLLFALRIG
jgi:hypothetical protein